MRALCVKPGNPGSGEIREVSESTPFESSVLVETLEIGVCGTDREILQGRYGSPPPHQDHLVIGHESLGRVLEAPKTSPFKTGDLVVGIVRRPDPVPCANCAIGEWDMCRNGLYTEHGIRGLDGFARDRYRVPADALVRLDPKLERVGVLLETASVLAKAWEQIERIGARALWNPRRVLVTGAGPVGMMAAMMGVQRGLEVHVLDRLEGGPKSDRVRELGAFYHHQGVNEACEEPDIIIECTGMGKLVFDAMGSSGPSGIVCLTGVSSGGRTIPVDAGAINRTLVLENHVIFGSVNANRRHYELAAKALAQADLAWLERLITKRVPLEHWKSAFEKEQNDVKCVITFDKSVGHGRE